MSDTMYSICNATVQPEDLMVTISFEPGDIYVQELDPGVAPQPGDIPPGYPTTWPPK